MPFPTAAESSRQDANQHLSLTVVQGSVGTATAGTVLTMPVTGDPTTGAMYVYNLGASGTGGGGGTSVQIVTGTIGTILGIGGTVQVSGASAGTNINIVTGSLVGTFVNNGGSVQITDNTTNANVLNPSLNGGTLAQSGQNAILTSGAGFTSGTISLSAATQSTAWFDMLNFPSWSVEILTNTTPATLTFQTSSDASQTNISNTGAILSSTQTGGPVLSTTSAVATYFGNRTGRYFRITSNLAGGNTATLVITLYTTAQTPMTMGVNLQSTVGVTSGTQQTLGTVGIVNTLAAGTLTALASGTITGGTIQNFTSGTFNIGTVDGLVASGVADAGNPLKVGGVYNTTQPTLTNGQRGDAQLSTRSAFLTSIVDRDGTIGWALSSNNGDNQANVSALPSLAQNRIFNASNWDRQRTTNGANNTTGIGITSAGIMGVDSGGTYHAIAVTPGGSQGTIILPNIPGGTVQISTIPVQVGTSFMVQGTTATAVWGTIQAASGSGTKQYVSRTSIVVVSGTVDIAVTNSGIGGSTGAGVLERGVFPPGGGITNNYDPVMVSGTNGTLAYWLGGAGTVDITVNYWQGV